MFDKTKFDLDELAATTYSAVFSDVCDQAGLRNQTFEAGMSKLAGPDKVLIGWARTAISVPINHIPERPYGGEIDFVDSLSVGDVVVLDCSGRPAAAWGELFSSAATGRGARGAIIDGLIRDSEKIDALDGFPVFGRGTRPTDALGRVGIREYDCPVTLYGCPVFPGDLIVADRDGACVVPQAQAEDLIARAVGKALVENEARDLLLNGGYLREVWEKYRVL
ncbi:RraA family protein [Martelella mediterranea]|uniref:RraA family protein n=1 Tax=Martelella mediterranea TaxID=293089 RepID=UPI001E5F5DB9|nr:RraA family protein [Martelella mediterranea]MCD1635793.1 RraA family protein [Martelella mediterranea]